jgi:hypothetical protein
MLFLVSIWGSFFSSSRWQAKKALTIMVYVIYVYYKVQETLFIFALWN